MKQISDLQAEISSLTTSLEEEQQKRADAEKEQEDLLVLLDELSMKRKGDKERLRTAGLDVSEDEDAGEDAEGSDDEDD